jgi:D-alanyl-D-alanine carboxypeptidase
MVAVLMGVPNRKDRDKFASQLLDWGYRRAENPSAVDEAPAKSVAKKKAAAATGVKAPTSKKTSSKKPAKKAPASEEERSREAIRR